MFASNVFGISRKIKSTKKEQKGSHTNPVYNFEAKAKYVFLQEDLLQI